MKRTSNPTADDILSFYFAVYLNVAFKNCRIGHWRKKNRIKTVSIDDDETSNKTKLALSVQDSTLEENLAEISDNPAIVKAINSLSDIEKKVLSLYVIEKYSLTEVSKLLDIEYGKLSYMFSKIKNIFKRSLTH